MKKTLIPRTAALAMTISICATALLDPTGAVSPSAAAEIPQALNLGAKTLPEKRTKTVLAPGLTHIAIERGNTNATFSWTAEVTIPSPDAAVSASALADEDTAERVARDLRANGIDARVERVDSPELADAGGFLGFRVRAGHFQTEAAAEAATGRIKEAGYAASTWFTGWDGAADSQGSTNGMWSLDVLRIDPKKFKGSLKASYGPDLQQRETTSELAGREGAIAAINGGFFVFDPLAGAEGDPAGAGVYAGEVLSESVGDRPTFIFDGKKLEADVNRFTWDGSVSSKKKELPLDGINRVPGMIRNCGGTPDDIVTGLPLHDITCTDDDEIVALTPEFGVSTPSGPGLEVLLNAKGVVTAVNETRGTTVPADGSTVQAIGSAVGPLSALAEVGNKLTVNSELINATGQAIKTGRSDFVINGAPQLIDGGRIEVTAAQDGMVHADNPGMFYGWAHQRNPRTIAGVDSQGRIVLVTADGRRTDSLGLSLQEAAQVAQSLGMVEAINLDGGGSTTMVIDDSVVNAPSNAGGAERAVGGALLIMPGNNAS